MNYLEYMQIILIVFHDGSIKKIILIFRARYIEIIKVVRHPKEKFLPAAHYKAWTLGVRHASKVRSAAKKSRCEVSASLAGEHCLASTFGVRIASNMFTSTEIFSLQMVSVYCEALNLGVHRASTRISSYKEMRNVM